MPRILLLSAYHADSHSYWCTGLMAAFPEFDWTLLTLPPRHFSWRIRGNSLTWAYTESESFSHSYDLIIATSMVDLSGLRGLVPKLSAVPAIVYFHENQFAYPRSGLQHPSVEPQMVNLYAALCADRLGFNSHYNRSSFLEGVAELLKKLPDGVPSGLVQKLEERSTVLPVPLQDSAFRPSCAPGPGAPLNLIWNHRWEYDKGPERLLAALQLIPPDIALRIHVVGQQFRRQPPVMNGIRELLQTRGWLGSWGYVEDMGEYRRLLAGSHGALSTAIHDFQGLAILEAVAAGCIPLAPRRLAYPEWFGAENCYPSGGDSRAEARALADAIEHLAQQHLSVTLPRAPDLNIFRWGNYRSAYLQLFRQASQAF